MSVADHGWGRGDQYVLLPRGALAPGRRRDLVVVPSLMGAYEAGSLALDTFRPPDNEVTQAFLVSGQPPRRLREKVVCECADEVVWAGDTATADGRFLLHSAARLWALLPGGPLEGTPVVLTRGRDSRFVEDWLRAFGARVAALPPRGAARFRSIRAPEPAWRFQSWIAPELRDVHLHARSGLDVRPRPRNDVLWLSRGGLGEGKAHDEALLEWVLGDRVTAVRPEEMPLAEQVALFESSRAVAGVAGSPFHTLLMTAETPDVLCLCPPWDKGSFPAQHRLLDCRAAFVCALTVTAWSPRVRERGIFFPDGYRLSIPASLRALAGTVHPALLEDPRIAAFADPGRGAAGEWRSELDEAALAVVREPHAIGPRARLGAAFRRAGLDRPAREQEALVEELGGDADGATGGGRIAPGEPPGAGRETIALGATHALRPRGSLSISGPRRLTTARGLAGAYGPDRRVDRSTLRLAFQAAIDIGVAPTACEDRDAVAEIEQEAVWVGMAMTHYGHFLAENPSRLWPLLPDGELAGLPAVLTTRPSRGFVREWLEAFGVEILSPPPEGPVRFARMRVPEEAWRMGAWIAPELRDVHLHARSGLDVRPRPRNDVLWLSRGGLGEGKAHDEALLEWVLGDRVTAVRPEEMPLAEQVALFESSRAVAGVAGSAFHTLLMAERTPDSLYLCSPIDRGTFAAQHMLLDGRAAFSPTLELMALDPAIRRRRAAQGYLLFPEDHRLSIPASLRALAGTVHPALLEDPRIAAFADPGRGAAGEWRSELDEAALAVVREPYAIGPRRRLAAQFEAAGLRRLAAEQLTLIARMGAATPGAA